MSTTNKPKFCHTASGYLVRNGKVLLIKHKKMNAWLPPGGHIEKGELPYQAAEREFLEETGAKVVAIGYESEDFLPTPFKCGLHWVCQENFDRRLSGEEPIKKWSKGCEKHFDEGFLMKLESNLEFKANELEIDELGWFGLNDIEQHTNIFEDVKKSIFLAIKLDKMRSRNE